MKQKLLLPHRYKKIGWFIFIPALILGLMQTINRFQGLGLNMKVFTIYSDRLFEEDILFGFFTTDVTNTVLGVLLIIGALLVSFSQEKVEDEFIANIRLSSLLWAVLINYGLLLFCFLFFYNFFFVNVMTYNMFTILLIFIARFHFVLYKNSHDAIHEKHN